ncbi:hypothetical protein [Azorhizophilus paspali]|uniref:Uncharacterized protein n=1 Tax=Azorhizophilus paspali TaxID=69963 RepID=A0ABV6SLN6_AZOPA
MSTIIVEVGETRIEAPNAQLARQVLEQQLGARIAEPAMSFPADTRRPQNHRLTVHMAGNAVSPVAGAEIIRALRAAA